MVIIYTHSKEKGNHEWVGFCLKIRGGHSLLPPIRFSKIVKSELCFYYQVYIIY